MVNLFVWSVVLFVSLGGFIFGYDIGSLNGVKDMRGYRIVLNLSSSAADNTGSSNGTSSSCDTQDDVETAAILGLIVSLISVGSLFGAIVSGVFSDKLGRKPAIILGACLTTASGILHTAALNLWMILLSRLIGGFGVGLLYQAVPLYVAEISPEKLRGRLLSFFTTYAITGIFVGTVINVGVKDLLYGWRISVGVQILLGTVMVLGVCFFPRSPRWLVKKHQDQRALKILAKMYKDQKRAEMQLDEIKSTVSSTTEPLLQTLKYVLQWNILKRLLIGVTLMVIGRFTGINFITYFSVSIFCGIGLPGFAVSVALTGVCVVGLFLSLLIIDKLGRKPLLLIGLFVMCVMHIASATLILAFDLEHIADGDVTVSQTVAGYSVLVLQCVFLSTATLSAGNVPWIVINEMFPIRGRGFMTSLCNAAFWVSLITVNQVSPVLISSPFNISGTLLLFAAVSFAELLFILLVIPETKDYTLEGIEEMFSKPWSVRVNIQYYLRCGCFLPGRAPHKQFVQAETLGVTSEEDGDRTSRDELSSSQGDDGNSEEILGSTADSLGGTDDRTDDYSNVVMYCTAL